MDARTDAPAFTVETIELDLPALAGAFSARLHAAGLPVTVDRAAGFTRALVLVRPIARRRLYWTARAMFVSDPAQVRAFDRVFREVFGEASRGATEPPPEARTTAPATDDERATSPRDLAPESSSSAASVTGEEPEPSSEPRPREVPVALAPSEEEVLRSKRFDELSPRELAQLYRLMARLEVATPLRRTRRAQRYRHGERIDLRRTLRGSLRTGGDPIQLRRRRRRVLPRNLVLLCDISGSMEPYARAYLQFLACAAGSGVGGSQAEAFVFATRLTRLTRALASRNPERAIQSAAAAAPDWSSGTRIGDALKAFNDRHGRRGLARGAVVVIISDGWERGDPSLVGQEMARLHRLAHRIVWVNPRVGADGFAPRAGGMAAALPYLDALVSGHSLEAMDAVIDAIGAHGRDSAELEVAAGPEEDDEPWASATPVSGSSVSMPSGYGPSRGRTTPGWDP